MEHGEEAMLHYRTELLNSIPGTVRMPAHQPTVNSGFVVIVLQNFQPANGDVSVA